MRNPNQPVLSASQNTSPLYRHKGLTQHDQCLSFITLPEHILDMEHSVHPPPFCWGTSYLIFKKDGGGLTRPQFLEGMTFFRGVVIFR